MRSLTRLLLCSIPLFLGCSACRTVQPPREERILKLHYAQNTCMLGCYKEPLVLEGKLQLKPRPCQFVISRISGKDKVQLFRSHTFHPSGQPVSFRLSVSQQLPLKGYLTVEASGKAETSTFVLLPDRSDLCKAVSRNTENGPVDHNMIILDYYTLPDRKTGAVIDAETKTSVSLSFEVHPVTPADNAAGARK